MAREAHRWAWKGPRNGQSTLTGAAAALPPAFATTRVRRRSRQIAVAAAITTAAAAGIATVLVLAPITTLSPGSPGGPPAQAAAAEILHRAAVAAGNEPDVQPRPAQYVYVRSQDAGGVREVWLSVDGTRDGLVRSRQATLPLPGCRNGRQVVVKGDGCYPGSPSRARPTPPTGRTCPRPPRPCSPTSAATPAATPGAPPRPS